MEAVFQAGPQWLPSAKRKQGQYVSAAVMLAVWLYGFLDRLFTPQGRIFGAVYLGVAFYSTILTRSPAVILFFIFSEVFSFFRVCGLSGMYPHGSHAERSFKSVTRSPTVRFCPAMISRQTLPCNSGT